MQHPPQDWPRISASVFYEAPAAAIDWLCSAFGFEVRLKIEGDKGTIVHSELVYAEGVVMVGSADDRFRKSPKQLGGVVTQALMVYVDDIEAHHARAVSQGAKVTRALAETEYGDEWYVDRGYEAEDVEGHRWYFTQRLREAKAPKP
jgi:uncharacterized glyoxalase superfamily protein PhnB